MFFTDIKPTIAFDSYHFVVLKAVESHVKLIVNFWQVSHTLKPVFVYLVGNCLACTCSIDIKTTVVFTSYITSSFLLKM